MPVRSVRAPRGEATDGATVGKPRIYGEICAWPGCMKAISWKQAWCYRHWKLVPESERRERTAAVFAARQAAQSGAGSEESTVRTEPTGESTDEAAGGDR
jgi:hypothetical protein